MKKTTLKPKKTIRASKKPVAKSGLKQVESEQEPLRAVSLFNLKAPKGSHKPRKIKGRGPSSGHGKTSTRGSKGQTSRAGRHFYLGFEGGQSPLIRRMPKRGFTSKFKKIYQVVNLDDLNRIKEAAITLDILVKKGLIKDKSKLVKILGDGQIKNPVTVQAHAFSKKAAADITNAGGKIEIVHV